MQEIIDKLRLIYGTPAFFATDMVKPHCYKLIFPVNPVRRGFDFKYFDIVKIAFLQYTDVKVALIAFLQHFKRCCASVPFDHYQLIFCGSFNLYWILFKNPVGFETAYKILYIFVVFAAQKV